MSWSGPTGIDPWVFNEIDPEEPTVICADCKGKGVRTIDGVTPLKTIVFTETYDIFVKCPTCKGVGKLPIPKRNDLLNVVE